jgi:hypothetical protein
LQHFDVKITAHVDFDVKIGFNGNLESKVIAIAGKELLWILTSKFTVSWSNCQERVSRVG